MASAAIEGATSSVSFFSYAADTAGSLALSTGTACAEAATTVNNWFKTNFEAIVQFCKENPTEVIVGTIVVVSVVILIAVIIALAIALATKTDRQPPLVATHQFATIPQ